MGIIQKVRATGLLYSVAIVFNRLVPQWLFRFRRFVVFEIDTNQLAGSIDGPSLKTIQSSNSKVAFQVASNAEHVAHVQAVTLMNAIPEGNVQPWLATMNQEIVGGLWIAADRFAEPDLGIAYDLSPKQRWLFSARIIEQHRNQGIYQRFVAQVCDQMQQRQNILLAVNPHNKRSFAVHQKMATRRFGVISAARLFGFAIVLASKGIETNSRCSLQCSKRPITVSFKTKLES